MSGLSIATASLFVLIGVIDDLRTRKFHNWLFVSGTILAFVLAAIHGGLSGVNFALLGFVAGLVAFLPLVLLKVVGAGDMKLMAAIGAVIGWNTVFDVVVYSFIWGAIFGLVQVVLKGELRATLSNMRALASNGKRSELTLHKMPFTVAILMGWLTQLIHLGVMK